MAEPSTTEVTLILRRIYNAPVARIWRAWTTAEELGRWYLAGEDHVIHFAEVDLRVGGGYRIGFGPRGKTPYVETGTYVEITPMTRLAFDAGVTLGEGGALALALERMVVELTDLGDGRTELVLTDTGRDAWKSGEGWLPCLESLARHLASARADTPA
jgi:uncharacterized protein YndB with AHSA1/START domain